MPKSPVTVTVTGAAGQIGYALLFRIASGELRTLATRHAGGRLVSMLEGGYNLEALAECAVAHVGALRD